MHNRITAALLSFLLLTTTLVSCKKDRPEQPGSPDRVTEMEYFLLNNRVIKANAAGFSFDVTHDGRNDLAFSTLLVGDHLNEVDKLQFLVSTNIAVNLPVNAGEQIPVMNPGDPIIIDNFNGYEWFDLVSIVLVQKIISFTAPPAWQGSWKTAVQKYLPFQVIDNGKRYNGWVELSVDIRGENIIVHRAAMSKTPNQIVYAGK